MLFHVAAGHEGAFCDTVGACCRRLKVPYTPSRAVSISSEKAREYVVVDQSQQPRAPGAGLS
jgi:hypothetical protein